MTDSKSEGNRCATMKITPSIRFRLFFTRTFSTLKVEMIIYHMSRKFLEGFRRKFVLNAKRAMEKIEVGVERDKLRVEISYSQTEYFPIWIVCIVCILLMTFQVRFTFKP